MTLIGGILLRFYSGFFGMIKSITEIYKEAFMMLFVISIPI